MPSRELGFAVKVVGEPGLPSHDSRRWQSKPHLSVSLERLAAAAATGRLVFDLAVAEVWGRFRPVAELRVGDQLPPETDALRFNPWNAGGGLEPTGLLNRLRDYAYPLSQRSWTERRRTGRRARGHAGPA